MKMFSKKSSGSLQSLPRTLEGKLFELVFIFLALLSWGFIAWLIGRAPDVVPTHFDAAGRPNGWGTPLSVVFPCIIITVVGACMLAGASFPRRVTMPFSVQSPRQQLLAARMLRVLSLLMLVLQCVVAVSMLGQAIGYQPDSNAVLIYSCVGLIILTCIVFTWLIWRARTA